MPRAAAGGRPRPLIEPLRFQILRLAVEVHPGTPETAEALGFVANHAEQPTVPTAAVEYRVMPEATGLMVHEDGVQCDLAPSAQSTLETIMRRVTDRALALYPHRTLVRGAVAIVGGKRTLLVGESGSGITALALRLVLDGESVEGDAFALLGAGGLVTLPRPFCLRDGILDVVPDVGAFLPELPSLDNSPGRIWAFDPVRAGFAWRVEGGPIDRCVAVEPNHGARTRIEPAPHHEMVRRVMARAAPRQAGASWVRRVAALVDGARCDLLHLGTPADAVMALRSEER